MKLEEVLPELRAGKVIRRRIFKKEIVIWMQIPTNISQRISDIRSIPEEAKVLIIRHGGVIKSRNEFIFYDFEENLCSPYTFGGEDLNADDWEVVDVLKYNPHG